MNHDKRTGRYQAVTKRGKPYLYAPLSDQKADNKQSNIPFAWSDNRTSVINVHLVHRFRYQAAKPETSFMLLSILKNAAKIF